MLGRAGKFFYFWIWLRGNVKKVNGRACCPRNKVAFSERGEKRPGLPCRRDSGPPPLLPGVVFPKTQKPFPTSSQGRLQFANSICKLLFSPTSLWPNFEIHGCGGGCGAAKFRDSWKSRNKIKRRPALNKNAVDRRSPYLIALRLFADVGRRVK